MPTATAFQPVKKKYALVNSYYKFKAPNAPDTILDIAQYHLCHNSLPFEYSGTNWVYDAFCERQKRTGVMMSQFLTPDSTAARIAMIANEYFTDKLAITDACCGTGQLTSKLLEYGYRIEAFDIDQQMVSLCEILYSHSNDVKVYQANFEYIYAGRDAVVSNPPYENIPAFLAWLKISLNREAFAVLLLPKNSVDKERPKTLAQTMSNFRILHREDMEENFARTQVKAEIVVLQRI